MGVGGQGGVGSGMSSMRLVGPIGRDQSYVSSGDPLQKRSREGWWEGWDSWGGTRIPRFPSPLIWSLESVAPVWVVREG